MENKEYKLIADVTVCKGKQVLLVRYADSTNQGDTIGWSLPDELITYGEHPTDEVNKILKDQLGLEYASPSLDHIESFIGQDASWHLVFHFNVELDYETKITASNEIANCEWFAIDDLPHKDEVTHDGWALTTIENIFSRKS